MCNTTHAQFVRAYLASDAAPSCTENVAVLADFNHISEDTVRQIDTLIQNEHRIDRSVWINDYFNPCKLKTDLDSLRGYQEGILRAIGEPVEVICTWTLYNRFEQLVMETYPDADVVMYEDGYSLYVARPIANSLSPQQSAEERLVSVMTRSGVAPEHILRVVQIPHILGGGVEKPKYLADCNFVDIGTSVFHEMMLKVAQELGVNWSVNAIWEEQKIALLIGTPLHQIAPSLSWERERDIYAIAAHRLIGEGYHVLWRDHPRVKVPFAKSLSGMLPVKDFSVLQLPSSVPLEYVACMHKIDVSISIGSTAQMSMKKFNGVPFKVIDGDDFAFISETGDSLPQFRQNAEHFWLTSKEAS